jgi:hypothetical protein
VFTPADELTAVVAELLAVVNTLMNSPLTDHETTLSLSNPLDFGIGDTLASVRFVKRCSQRVASELDESVPAARSIKALSRD